MDVQRVKAGTPVTFRISDVVCPEFQQVLEQLGPELAVQGEVAFVSDGGDEKGCFAIVDVHGIHSPLIVPIRLLSVLGERQQGLADRYAQSLAHGNAGSGSGEVNFERTHDE